jgi:hypothetical protein
MRLEVPRFCLAAVFALGASASFSQDCSISINERDPGKDVTRILRCFDERIKALESQLNASGAPQAHGAQSTAGEFDAGAFAVSVRSAIRSGNSVNVLLSLRNKTTDDVHIGVLNRSGEGATLFDESSGNSDDRLQASGLKVVNTWSKKEDYSVIPGGSMLSATYTFSGTKIQGTVARLNLLLTQFSAPDPKKVTVSLGVRIRN